MRILAFDPGLERIGYAVIDREGSSLKPITYGLITTPKIALPDRLKLAHEEAQSLIREFKPERIATERLLFAQNKTTAMDVAKALGVVLLACSASGATWTEYSPPQIKQAVVGTGSADKKQVQFMVTRLLSLKETPKPDDVADALAIAICDAFASRLAAPKPSLGR